MPKVKSHKGANKRLKKTGSGKLMHRTAGQDHFNSRQRGTKINAKRRDSTLASVNKRLKAVISK